MTVYTFYNAAQQDEKKPIQKRVEKEMLEKKINKIKKEILMHKNKRVVTYLLHPILIEVNIKPCLILYRIT